MKNDKFKLSNTCREILTSLVNLYRKKGCALKIVEIVENMNSRSPGTIRNLMQTMRTLGLVKGIPGPGGGYLPTELAFETIGFGQEAKGFPIYRNEELSEVTLYELRVKPPNSSILHVIGDTRDFKIGDRIKVASDKLIFSGKVEGRNDLNNSLLSSIEVAFLRGLTCE